MADKPNADGVLGFEQDFREFERKLIEQDIPHDIQVRGIAYFLAHSFAIPVLELIKDQGFDGFTMKVANGLFDLPIGVPRTDFTEDDLRRVYTYILRVLDERLARTRLTVTH